jgi:hypothetical protein
MGLKRETNTQGGTTVDVDLSLSCRSEELLFGGHRRRQAGMWALRCGCAGAVLPKRRTSQKERRAATPRALRLGVWIGARVGSHRCPVFRTAHLHFNDAVGVERGDRAEKMTRSPLTPPALSGMGVFDCLINRLKNVRAIVYMLNFFIVHGHIYSTAIPRFQVSARIEACASSITLCENDQETGFAGNADRRHARRAGTEVT